MIGLILGDTHIGKIIVKKLLKLKKRFIIIDISKKNLFKKNKNSYSLTIGQLGKCISILKNNKCKNIIFAGRVLKPNFKKVKFDFKALYHLPTIIRETKKGDSYIIKFITNLFMKEGFKIISQIKYNPEIVLKKGCFTNNAPDKLYKKDILVGKKVINDLSRRGVAQGVIVINGRVISTENYKGTDALIKNAYPKIRKLRKQKKKKRLGILLKLPKPNQDLRTDLPTIGLKTIKSSIKVGLKGIVVKGNYNIFLNKSKCIKMANKNNMFIYAL